MSTPRPGGPPRAGHPDHEEAVLRAVREVRYGSVEVTIHDGRIVQIERKEKQRFENRFQPDRTHGGPAS
jgi:hypothetical protein